MYLDEKDVKNMVDRLNQVSRSGLPIVARNTVNDLAFNAREAMQDEIRNNFTNRNKWTAGSVKVKKATQYHIEDVESRVGSTEDYMRIQHYGGHVKANKSNKPIAMLSARVGKSSQKTPKKQYRMSNLKLGGKLFYTKNTGKAGIFLKLRNRKIQKLWDLSNPEVNIKKTSWMDDAMSRLPLKMLSVEHFKNNFDKWWNKNGWG